MCTPSVSRCHPFSFPLSHSLSLIFSLSPSTLSPPPAPSLRPGACCWCRPSARTASGGRATPSRRCSTCSAPIGRHPRRAATAAWAWCSGASAQSCRSFTASSAARWGRRVWGGDRADRACRQNERRSCIAACVCSSIACAAAFRAGVPARAACHHTAQGSTAARTPHWASLTLLPPCTPPCSPPAPPPTSPPTTPRHKVADEAKRDELAGLFGLSEEEKADVTFGADKAAEAAKAAEEEDAFFL